MATVTRTHTFNDGDTLTAAQLNTEFNNILNAPAIMNADVASNAAIAISKIAAGTLTGYTIGSGTVMGLGSDAQGDIFYNNGSNLTRLAPGTSGQVLQTQGASANPQWYTVLPQLASAEIGTTLLTTTSTSFVDITGLSVTITTSANSKVFLSAVLPGVRNENVSAYVYATFVIDGVATYPNGSAFMAEPTADTGSYQTLHLSFIKSGLSAGSHTFKVQWKVNSGTGDVCSGQVGAGLYVIEFKQ